MTRGTEKRRQAGKAEPAGSEPNAQGSEPRAEPQTEGGMPRIVQCEGGTYELVRFFPDGSTSLLARLGPCKTVFDVWKGRKIKAPTGQWNHEAIEQLIKQGSQFLPPDVGTQNVPTKPSWMPFKPEYTGGQRTIGALTYWKREIKAAKAKCQASSNPVEAVEAKKNLVEAEYWFAVLESIKRRGMSLVEKTASKLIPHVAELSNGSSRARRNYSHPPAETEELRILRNKTKLLQAQEQNNVRRRMLEEQERGHAEQRAKVAVSAESLRKRAEKVKGIEEEIEKQMEEKIFHEYRLQYPQATDTERQDSTKRLAELKKNLTELYDRLWEAQKMKQDSKGTEYRSLALSKRMRAV